MDEMNNTWEVAKEAVAEVAEAVKEAACEVKDAVVEAASDVADVAEEKAAEVKVQFCPEAEEEDCPACKCKKWIDDTLYEINCLWNEHKQTILVIAGIVAGVAAAVTALCLILKRKEK